MSKSPAPDVSIPGGIGAGGLLMKTILIVDDMAIFREPVEAVLKSEGYRTLTASSGREAMAILTSQVPDMILLDITMPAMDGLKLLTQIRENVRLKDVPEMMMSAVEEKPRIIEAAKLGIAGYILKSQFSLKELLRRLQGYFKETAAPKKTGGPGAAPAGAGAPNPASVPGAKAAVVVPGATPVPAPEVDPEAARADPIAALKALTPIIDASELARRVAACAELKAFSPAVAHVIKLTTNANCPADAVAKAISQDHAVALKVLKLANSSVYTRGAPVDSLYKAVVRIGMERIRQTILNIGVVERFSSVAFKEYLSTAQFWEHAIACGIIAAEIAHATDEKAADTAFTSGLLHDVGRVVFAEQLGQQYADVIATARRLDLPLEQVESRMLGANHADVMEQILKSWNFPKDLISPIAFHHLSASNARAAAPHQVQEVMRLGLANRLAHALMLGSSGNDTIYPTEDLCEGLRITPEVVARIEGVARQQTDDMKFAMLAQSSGAVWPQTAEQVRQSLRSPFRPVFVSASPATDAFRIFIDRLAGPPGEEPRTIAVVHLKHAQERAELSAKLLAAEREAAVGGLPLLVLSPAGKFSLDESAIAGRYVKDLPTPVTISRFVAEVNSAADQARLKAAA